MWMLCTVRYGVHTQYMLRWKKNSPHHHHRHCCLWDGVVAVDDGVYGGCRRLIYRSTSSKNLYIFFQCIFRWYSIHTLSISSSSSAMDVCAVYKILFMLFMRGLSLRERKKYLFAAQVDSLLCFYFNKYFCFFFVGYYTRMCGTFVCIFV